MAGLKKDGTEFPFQLSISQVNTGESILFTGITRDLTEEVCLEEENSLMIVKQRHDCENQISKLMVLNASLKFCSLTPSNETDQINKLRNEPMHFNLPLYASL